MILCACVCEPVEFASTLQVVCISGSGAAGGPRKPLKQEAAGSSRGALDVVVGLEYEYVPPEIGWIETISFSLARSLGAESSRVKSLAVCTASE